jgi:hypothetical protein
MFLDSIVGEVDLRCEVVNVKFIGCRADIPLFVPVGTGYAEEVADEHVVADIKFSVVV